MSDDQHEIRVAIAVIDERRAGWRRVRYETNLSKAARKHGASIAQTVRFRAKLRHPEALIFQARDLTGANVVYAPSLDHLRGTHELITPWADIHVVGRGRTYLRGHRWPS